MKNIDQLNEEYLKITEPSKKALFLFDNRNDILRIDETVDKKHFNVKSRMLTDLSFEYSSKGRYTEAVDIFKIVIELFENEYPDSVEEIPFYEKLIWNYARSLFEIKKYGKAEKEFKKLYQLDPKNEDNKNWYFGTIKKRTWIQTRFFWFFCALFLVLSYTVKDNINPKLWIVIYVLTAISVILGFSLEIIGLIKRTKAKNHGQ